MTRHHRYEQTEALTRQYAQRDLACASSITQGTRPEGAGAAHNLRLAEGFTGQALCRLVGVLADEVARLREAVEDERVGAPVHVALDSLGDGVPAPRPVPRPVPRPGPLARFPISEGAAARVRDARLRQGVDQRAFVRRHRAAGVYWSSAVQSNLERAQRRSTRGDMDALTAALGVEFTLAGGEWQ